MSKARQSSRVSRETRLRPAYTELEGEARLLWSGYKQTNKQRNPDLKETLKISLSKNSMAQKEEEEEEE